MPSCTFISCKVIRGPIWGHTGLQFSCPPSFKHVQTRLPQQTYLGQTDGALFGRHVASARVDLRQLSYIVLAVLFCFTFRKVRPSESCEREQHSWDAAADKRLYIPATEKKNKRPLSSFLTDVYRRGRYSEKQLSHFWKVSSKPSASSRNICSSTHHFPWAVNFYHHRTLHMNRECRLMFHLQMRFLTRG